MLRKLVALLVLVTGLAAVGQPARALNVDVASVGSAIDSGCACAVPAGHAAARAVPRAERGEARPKACPKPPRVVLVVPTVMLHADRARE